MKPPTLWSAVYAHDARATQEALINTKNVNEKHGIWQNTSLHYAARNGDLYILRLLLQEPSIDVNTLNINGTTALHLAIENNNEKIVQELVNANARTDKRNYTGMNALELASKLNYIRIRSILNQIKK